MDCLIIFPVGRKVIAAVRSRKNVRVIGKLTGYNFLSFSNLNNFLLGSQSRFVFDCSEL